MAFDAKTLLRDGSASGSLTASSSTPAVLLGGTPLRGLQCSVVVPAAAGSTPILTVELMEGASTGATHYAFHSYPVNITATGEYKMRFHLNSGYKSVKARYTVSGTSADFGAVSILIRD